MLRRLKGFLARSPYMKISEHLALAFASAFALTAIGTLENAAGSHGFSFTWSFVAGVALTAATAAYHKIRPQLLKLFGRVAFDARAAIPYGSASSGESKVTITKPKP